MAIHKTSPPTSGAPARSGVLQAKGDEPPYFFWDRRITVAELRDALAAPSDPEHLDLFAHLLREARPDEVWDYVSPAQVAAEWPLLASRLGRRRDFWAWLLDSWRQLGFLDSGP